MRTRQDILAEIQRAARENGGRPLGIARFESETGIKPYDWERFWARFGDAIKEAGFAPNQLNPAYDDEYLSEKIIGLIRKLGRFPTFREFTGEKTNDAQFPNKKVFQRRGSKAQLAAEVLEYCKSRDGYDDITAICAAVIARSHDHDASDSLGEPAGEVYLFKSGRYFKIGKTNDTVRRGSELRVQLPEKVNLVHSIKTDDPSGIEAYWHKRFESKRMNGEWFDLNSADVKAFKRWRRIC